MRRYLPLLGLLAVFCLIGAPVMAVAVFHALQWLLPPANPQPRDRAERKAEPLHRRASRLTADQQLAWRKHRRNKEAPAYVVLGYSAAFEKWQALGKGSALPVRLGDLIEASASHGPLIEEARAHARLAAAAPDVRYAVLIELYVAENPTEGEWYADEGDGARRIAAQPTGSAAGDSLPDAIESLQRLLSF